MGRKVYMASAYLRVVPPSLACGSGPQLYLHDPILKEPQF